jgi:hypothetical protein
MKNAMTDTLLVHLQSTVLLAPTVVRLLYDLGFFARLRQRLAIRYSDLNLPQQVHDLLRCMLLASRDTSLLLLQFYRFSTGTKEPGTPLGSEILVRLNEEMTGLH